jgi:hypothetical protein
MASRSRCQRSSGAGRAVDGGQADAAVEGHPAHEAAVGEVLLAAAGLRDALVRAVPVVAEPVEHGGDLLPAVVPDVQSVLVGEEDAVHGFAVDVELQLVRGSVADADWLRAAVAPPVGELVLDQVAEAVDPLHDLERGVLPSFSSNRSRSQPIRAAASPVKPSPSSAYTENDASRIHV